MAAHDSGQGPEIKRSPLRAPRRGRRLQNDPIQPIRPRGPGKLVAILLAGLLLFGPYLGYLAGKRPVAFENHALAPFPNAGAGWGFPAQFDTWATDHLMGRKQAVSAYDAFEATIFHEAPSTSTDSGSGVTQAGGGQAGVGEQAQLKNVPPVLQGKDGYLYYWVDIGVACSPSQRWAADLQQLEGALAASGRTKVYFTIAPDKTTIQPEHLPDHYVGRGCSPASRARFWGQVARTPPPGYVPILPALQGLESRGPDSPYLARNTHWNGLGAVTYAQAMAEAIAPGSTAMTELARDPHHTYPSDLSQLQNGPPTEQGLYVLPKRAGVTTRIVENRAQTVTPPSGTSTTGQIAYPVWHAQSSSTAAPLVPGRVLVLGDSFTEYSVDQLAPYFQDVTWRHIDTLLRAPQMALAAIRQADVIIIERSERELRASGIQMYTGLDRQISELGPPAP